MQKFIRFITENAHFTLLIIGLISFYGLFSLSSMKVSQEPELDSPSLWLEFHLQGASPDEMQQNVVFPIENELQEIEGVDSVRTTINSQFASMYIKFDYGHDMDEKVREVETEINQIKRNLPQNLLYFVGQLVLSKIQSAFVLGLDTQGRDDKQLAETLKKYLQSIPALSKVKLMEGEDNVVVALDAESMHHLDISYQQVQRALISHNRFLSQGTLDIANQSLQFSGSQNRFTEVSNIADQTLIYSGAGNPVKLRDIATVKRQPQRQSVFTRYQSSPVRLIEISVKEDANVLLVRQDIETAIASFSASLSSDVAHPIEIHIIFDQSEGVRLILADLVINLLQGMGILVIVLLFTVGYRSAFIISMIVPLSFVIALTGLGATGYGIQQVSIVGLIIALGLLVDNAIVVTENSYLLSHYQGMDKKDAAVSGSAQVIGPLLTSTLTTMLAFLPLFMQQSDEGLYLRSLTVSIWLALGASLFVAVTLTVLMLSTIGTNQKVRYLPPLPSLLIALIPFRDKYYARFIHFVVRFRWVTLFFFTALLLFTVWQSSKLAVDLFPLKGDPYLTVNVNFPVQPSDSSRRALALEIEQRLKRFDDQIESVLTIMGTEPPRINAAMNYLGDTVLLVKTRYSNDSFLKKLKTDIERHLTPLQSKADITVSLFQLQDVHYTADMTLRLSGIDTQALKTYAKDIHSVFAENQSISRVHNPMQADEIRLQLQFNDERAQMLGISKADVDPLINLLTYGVEIDRFRDTYGEEFPLLLRFATNPVNPAEILSQLHIDTAGGGSVPLSEIISIGFEAGETEIMHLDFRPTIEIDLWLKPGYESWQVSDTLKQTLEARGVPQGITISEANPEQEKIQDFMQFFKDALIVAGLIFSIFVLQFKSFRQPFIIFTAIPFCMIGALLALIVTDQPISFFSAVGITGLLGIVVNDSILLVDEGNNIRRERPELSLLEVATEASRNRFMPVLLTSLTTIAGLIPLAFSDSMFKGMAVAIIGGMISSTVLILVLVPSSYALMSAQSRKTR